MDNCEKAFREKGNLLTHLRTHNSGSDYVEESGDLVNFDRSHPIHANGATPKHVCDLSYHCTEIYKSCEMLLAH